jgi:hypothetical protein
MTYNTAARTTVMATIRMVAMTGDTASASLRNAQFFFMLCPPADLSARMMMNTPEPSLYSFADGYQRWALLIAAIAESRHLAMSQS